MKIYLADMIMRKTITYKIKPYNNLESFYRLIIANKLNLIKEFSDGSKSQ